MRLSSQFVTRSHVLHRNQNDFLKRDINVFQAIVAICDVQSIPLGGTFRTPLVAQRFSHDFHGLLPSMRLAGS